MNVSRKVLGLAAIATLVFAACSSSGGSASPSVGIGGPGGTLTPVKFQLQWVAQSQFAGYYAALDQGYYRDAGLDVSFLLGGPNINNVQVVATGGADIGTAWLPNMLQSREGGTDLVSIAQIFQRSGTRMAGVQGGQHHQPGHDGRQEDRQLAGRQRARAVRRSDQGRARSDQGEHHQAELRHVGAAEG